MARLLVCWFGNWAKRARAARHSLFLVAARCGLMLVFAQWAMAVDAGDGSVAFQPAAGPLTRGQEFIVTVMFNPAVTTVVTGLDACIDFDPQVFADPLVTAENIADREMTNTSYGNSWPGHPDSFHYQRIALPGTTGWQVYAGPRAVYQLSFPVRSVAPTGMTTLRFAPGFITFSDANGELLSPNGIGQGLYDVLADPTATPTAAPTGSPTPSPSPSPSSTPTAMPSRTPTPTLTFSPTPGPPPPVPAVTGTGEAALILILALLGRAARRSRAKE